MDRKTRLFQRESFGAQQACSSGQPQFVSTLTIGRFYCARVALVQDLPALAQPTCSTEEDTRSRQERMSDDAATVKAARERPVSTCGSGHPETGRACPEPKALEQKTFHVENGVLVGRDMGRVRGVICSAHDGQPERHKHAYLLPIWSLWSRCVACGWRHENQVTTSSSFCIIALMRQAVVKA